METNEKMDQLLKDKFVTEEVKEEVKQVVVTRLTQGFEGYCRDIENKYVEFVKLIAERERLAEDAVPDIDFLIGILQKENKELRNISEGFTAINKLLEDFNSKLKPSKPLLPQEPIQHKPLPKIESAEKNVKTIHNSYFEVCTALGLDPQTDLAMQTFTEMGYQEVQRFIAQQRQAASKEIEDPHKSENAVEKTSELATAEQSHVNLGEKEKDKLANNREVKTYFNLITQLEEQADSLVSNGSTKSLKITDLGPIPQFEEDPLDPELQLALKLSMEPLPNLAIMDTSQEQEKLNKETAQEVLLQNLEDKQVDAAKIASGFGNTSS